MKEANEILSLTGLRFVAAFYVFLFHMHIRWPITDQPFLSNVVGQGAIGMSLFFTLSGFVLAYRYGDGRTTLKNYLVNRFARIYPVYLVAALLTLPWIGVTFGNHSPTDVVRGIGQGILLVFTNIFLLQAWFPQFFDYWNISGSWSISVEAFFYILLPLALPYLARQSLRSLIAIAWLCLLLAILPGLSAKLFNSPANIFYSMPIFRLPEFLIGACAYLAGRAGLSNRWGAIPQATALAAFLAYIGFLGPRMPYYIGNNWIALPVIAFLIFSLSNGKGLIARLLATRIFVWLGKVSYSFYSMQLLILLALMTYHDGLVRKIPSMADNGVLLIASLVLLLALSAAAYHFIEEPARRWIRRRQADIGEQEIRPGEGRATEAQLKS